MSGAMSRVVSTIEAASPHNECPLRPSAHLRTCGRPRRRFRVAVELPVVQEIVWVEVGLWENSKGKGILLSAPSHVKDLKSGSSFTFTGEMIVDYVLSDAEGVIEQGGIDELVRRLQSEG